MHLWDNKAEAEEEEEEVYRHCLNMPKEVRDAEEITSWKRNSGIWKYTTIQEHLLGIRQQLKIATKLSDRVKAGSRIVRKVLLYERDPNMKGGDYLARYINDRKVVCNVMVAQHR